MLQVQHIQAEARRRLASEMRFLAARRGCLQCRGTFRLRVSFEGGVMTSGTSITMWSWGLQNGQSRSLYDMYVAGNDQCGVSVLRLWKATASGFDMKKFNQERLYNAHSEQTTMTGSSTRCFTPPTITPRAKACDFASSISLFRHQFRILSSVICDSTPQWKTSPKGCHSYKRHPGDAGLMRILLDKCGYTWDDVADCNVDLATPIPPL